MAALCFRLTPACTTPSPRCGLRIPSPDLRGRSRIRDISPSRPSQILRRRLQRDVEISLFLADSITVLFRRTAFQGGVLAFTIGSSFGGSFRILASQLCHSGGI